MLKCEAIDDDLSSQIFKQAHVLFKVSNDSSVTLPLNWTFISHSTPPFCVDFQVLAPPSDKTLNGLNLKVSLVHELIQNEHFC